MATEAEGSVIASAAGDGDTESASNNANGGDTMGLALPSRGAVPDDEYFARNIKHYDDRITEVRKSCETIAGWCLASIVAASLRDSRPNTVAITLGVIGVAVGVYGSTLQSLGMGTSQRDRVLAALVKTYARRTRARKLVICLLLMALAALLADAWFPSLLP